MRVGRYINEVCQMLDLTVLTDIDLVPVSRDGVAGTNADLNGCDEFAVRTSVAIGQEAESAAGIRGVLVTNWFANEDELDEFCELNINRFRIAAQSGEVVDASEWR